MLAEQQAARVAAEGRVEADCVLEVLVRRSAEEQKLAQHLWQLQQEKVCAVVGEGGKQVCVCSVWRQLAAHATATNSNVSAC
jgi:hypothetical protein